ncbi:hypothetical protein ONZ51_g12640 [Trametes cubensis]|uniref:Uncharacterized protein n=1 Tax=Trametes cubensis TaxID=1111947 RepID=A0AAD7TFE3_9APHY|nr:hypothetical protein ONZ51_g12640 [Trametes cubensis]
MLSISHLSSRASPSGALELGGHHPIVLFKPRPYTTEPARWITRAQLRSPHASAARAVSDPAQVETRHRPNPTFLLLRGTVPCVRLVPHLPMHMDHDLPFPDLTSRTSAPSRLIPSVDFCAHEHGQYLLPFVPLRASSSTACASRGAVSSSV